jgi:hypothetical protein
MFNSSKTINDNQINDSIKQNDYAVAVRKLINLQNETWPALASGYNSLKQIKTKSFLYDEFSINVQFNPGRYISSSALVDEKSIKERKCFLCLENLPVQQKGIIVNDYILLANPYPIFHEHITISNLKHKNQRIENSFGDLLYFSKILSKDFTVIYNGPLCGASAPDHLHFQAGNSSSLPINSEFENVRNKYGKCISDINDCNIYGIFDGLRKIISFECKDEVNLISAFNSFYTIYSKNSNLIEPMMNILSSYNDETGWRILVMLRAKHRPDVFYKDKDERILFSPAASDFGGLCITPLKKDFERFNKELLINIFNEVSISESVFESLLFSAH